MRLQHEIVLPEPLALDAALCPQTAVRVLRHRHVVRQIVRQLGVHIAQLLRAGGGDVGQPVRREETDSNQDDGSRQRHRPADEQEVSTRHDAACHQAAVLHSTHPRRRHSNASSGCSSRLELSEY